jgi:hypothetical protein
VKQHDMKPRIEKPIPANPAKPRKAEAAFDMWLQRGLHQLYDDVTREPLPDNLLRLIEEDRQK